ncbi:MAG: FecR domain-containing protein [Acidobacteria bacterium]|nr:FecR domain-containing protein [Acidobacteriota bacterium]MBS1865196.1 FecR domain-containing protein [Acidobacteriota bacterium]
MKKQSPCAVFLAFVASWAILIPGDVLAMPQAASQKAGEVSRVIPAVSIARGAKTLNASAKTVVDWADVVNTQANARARIALDDGSVLNVGSDSSLKVTQHDMGAQQTQLDLAYGKLRSQAQKITKTDGKFEVKTPAGVAGVVGTDFYIAFDQTSGQMNLVVFEGLVKLCNTAGTCAMVKAGQMSSVRSNDSSAPTGPSQATLDVLTEAVNATNMPDAPSGLLRAGSHLSKPWGIALGIIAVGAAIAIPVAITKNTNNTPVNTKPPCPPSQCG